MIWQFNKYYSFKESYFRVGVDVMGLFFCEKRIKKIGSYNNYLYYFLELKLMNKINIVYNIDSFFGLLLLLIVWLFCIFVVVCFIFEREKYIFLSSEFCGKFQVFSLDKKINKFWCLLIIDI